MQKTKQYQSRVEAYDLKHGIPIEWAEKKVHKEDQMAPLLRHMERQNRYGFYFIYKSMEQGSTFRCHSPKFPTKDPHYTFYVRPAAILPITTYTFEIPNWVR